MRPWSETCTTESGAEIERSPSMIAKATASTPSLIDPDDEELKTYTCADCARTLEFLASNTNLVSMEYGWRLVREPNATGNLVAVWRCPPCWVAYKDGAASDRGRPASERIRKR